MTLLAVERIKLFSTRSPWWCMLLALVLTVGFTALIATNVDSVSVRMTQLGYRFGLMVMLVLAALSITTEYRFGTIRATFQAVPNRIAVMLAKTVVVAVLSCIVGEAVAFGSWATAGLLAPDANLTLATADDWRQVAGVGVVYAISAVLAVAVGMMLRHTAGAVALLLVWSLLAEGLIGTIPAIGDDVHRWLPFVAAEHFLSGTGDGGGTGGRGLADAAEMPFGPWGALAYFAAIAAGLWVIAVILVRRRDA